MLTCQNDVRGLLAVRGAHVYTLGADRPAPQPLPEPLPIPEPVDAWPAMVFDDVTNG